MIAVQLGWVERVGWGKPRMSEGSGGKGREVRWDGWGGWMTRKSVSA